MNAKNLTFPKVDGDFLVGLDEPGFYELTFTDYNCGIYGTRDLEVEVVFTTTPDDGSRMQVIIVKVADGVYQDFYFNGSDECFKLLTLNEDYGVDSDEEDSDEYTAMTMSESWKNESVGVECPSEYADYIPDPYANEYSEFYSKFGI